LKLHPAVFVAALFTAALAFHSSFPGLLGYDGFFHIAQARRMTELGLAPDQSWMSHGVVVGRWVDHHWGFHVLLMPFARWGLMGGKLGAALLGATSLSALYLWLRSRRVPLPELWAIAPVALSWSFLFRLMTVRAMCLSTGLLILVLHLAVRGPAWGLFLAAVGWALSYQLSVLAVPIAIGAWLVPRLMRRDGPSGWTAVAGPAGFATGLLVHPQSPESVRFFLKHVAIGAGAPSGTEWQPPLPSEFWMHGGVLLLVFLAAGALAWRRRSSWSPETVLLVLGALAGAALTLKSMRFVEFGAPLLAMAGGLLWRESGRELRRPVAVAATALLVVGLGANAITARDHRHPDAQRTWGAAAWLEEHVPPGTRIHNFQWGWWPEWVFAAPDYAYTVGFDPSLLASEGADKVEQFRLIREGYYREAGPAIRGEFGADWAVLGLPDAASDLLLADPSLEVMYRDPTAAVLRVR
jgi:hypothetical protein